MVELQNGVVSVQAKTVVDFDGCKELRGMTRSETVGGYVTIPHEAFSMTREVRLF